MAPGEQSVEEVDDVTCNASVNRLIEQQHPGHGG
jgi:hypothetical protein